MSETLKIGLVQHDIIWEDKTANFKKIRRMISSRKADIFILPEMFATGYTNKSGQFFEKTGGETESFLKETALKKQCYIGGGWIEKNPSGKPFNSYSIASPEGKITVRYRKIHPFSYAGEDKNYSAGEKTVLFKIGNFRLSIGICYDLRFPELFRSLAGKTDIFLLPANWPKERIHQFEILLAARSIENQCVMAAVNRVGQAGGIEYNGQSALYFPDASREVVGPEEKTAVFEVSLDELKKFRHDFPVLKDRRL